MNKQEFELILPTDIRLNMVSRQVAESEIAEPRIQAIIAAMSRIAIGERSPEHPELPSLVGLAAPQIGAFERIILFDMNALGGKANFDVDLRVVVNPEIIEASEEEELGREGCYSTGDIGGAIYRSKTITMKGLDETGKPVNYALQGFLARIAQHEIDHLNGIRFPDRVRDPGQLHAFTFKSEEFQRYREEWEHWPNLFPIEDWLKIKRGEK